MTVIDRTTSNERLAMHWKDIAQTTIIGSENDTMSFPEAVKRLIEAGLDGYSVDLRGATRSFYRPDGEVAVLPTAPVGVPVAERFDTEAIRQSIRKAQMQTPGYTYKGFCNEAAKAGCAGYIVSFIGRRVLYFGRNGDTHTEFFPAAT